MNYRSLLCLAFVALLLTSCGGGGGERAAMLDRADSLSYVRPDSALSLLDSLRPEKDKWPESQRMLYELLHARAQNKAYVDFTSDSVMLEVVRYYDSNGTSNQRMESHYLLGCVYRDLGEAPQAVNSFLNATSIADTTDKQTDFRLLGCIYSQMADVYYRQLLLSNSIEARKKARHFAELIGDTLSIISNIKLSAVTYIMMNKVDSAETMLKSAIRLYNQHGYEQEGLLASNILMFLYANRPDRQGELKQLIDNFEAKSNLFDSHHELPPSKRQYYYYKGRYFENSNSLDSAEYYYRKVYRPNMSPVDRNPMYKGLLSVFTRKNKPDSISKYARLYCEVNDSSIALKDQDLTTQMSASYNYSSYQKKAIESMEKAQQRQTYIIILLLILILVLVVAGVIWNHFRIYKQRKQQAIDKLNTEMRVVQKGYDEKMEQLNRLENTYNQTTNYIRKQLGEVCEENENLKTEYRNSQVILSELRSQFEAERQQLAIEIAAYKDKAEAMQRRLTVMEWKKSIPFFNYGIVKRVKDYYAKDVQKKLQDEELKQLVEASNDSFPDLVSDLRCSRGISELGLHVCILVILNLQPNEIVHLLGISSSQVSNIKKDINMVLFNDDTAKTLYKNLVNRYKIQSA